MGGFYLAFEGVGEGQGIVNDADVKSARQARLEHFKGALLILSVPSFFQEFLKGGDVCINVAVFHLEVLELIFHFYSCSNVHEGIWEAFSKVLLKLFI